MFSDQGRYKRFDNERYKGGSNYAPAVIGNQTIDFVTAALDSGQPFFAYVAPHAPHSPATPAPWYKDTFFGTRAPRTPSFNLHAPCHHFAAACQPDINFIELWLIDELARKRLQSLLTVNDIIKEVYKVVSEYGAIDSTYFIVTSDHGFHMGQHQQHQGKRMPYDTACGFPSW